MTTEKTRVTPVRSLSTLVVRHRCLLKVVRGAGQGTVVTLDHNVLNAGRSDEADLILDDPAASRHQFLVALRQGSYILRDLDSTNGTEVNHTPVVECRLSNGDIITVGETDVAFCEETQVEDPDAEKEPSP